MGADDRLLRASLIFTLAAHLAAMAGMAALLLPGMPGGPHAAVADRAAYVAGHPWLWRAGWLPWQITAASDLLLSAALLATPWVPRGPAMLAVIATVAAVVPDQLGQAMWTWPGVTRAAAAGYEPFEAAMMRRIAGYGTVGYLAAAVCWTWALAAAGTWSRLLTVVSAVVWPLFAASTAVLFWPGRPAGLAQVTSAGNAVAFVLLIVWLAEVARQVWRRDGSPNLATERAAHGGYSRSKRTRRESAYCGSTLRARLFADAPVTSRP